MKISSLRCAVFSLLCCACFAQLPDAPSTTQPPKPKTYEEWKGKKAGFFTVGRYDNPVPLRTTKQTVFSKSFLATEATMWSVGLADMKLNGCKGTAPCGYELKIDALVPLAVTSLGHWLLAKYVCAACGTVGPGVATEIHTKALINGVWP